jgi:UDP-N-acetylglucosamine transferase subunit ALG13
MIFLTIGTQLPFDRLTRAMDRWCALNPHMEVCGQIADPGETGYRPHNFDWETSIAPKAFDEVVRHAEVVVAHAGMGSIITALNSGTPIIIVPRKGELKEHRNDHQIATARKMQTRSGVDVAWEVDHLPRLLQKHTSGHSMVNRISAYADAPLIRSLRSEILGR